MTKLSSKDLIILARQVELRYKLDQYEDLALAEILRSVDRARKDIIRRLRQPEYMRQFAGAAKEFNTRTQELLQELVDLTVAIRVQLGEDIAEVATIAGIKVLPEQNDILSFGGRVPGFDVVSLTAAQIQAMVTEVPVGGYILQEWVDRTMSAGLKDKVKQEIMAGLFTGSGYPGLVDRIDQIMGDETRSNIITLVRTYVQSVNTAAAESVYRANDDVVKALEWSAVLEPGYQKTGRGTCIRCFTGDSRVYAPDALAATRMQYDGPVYDFESPSGDRFSVTPNHPFLTKGGWVTADKINDSVDIVYDSLLDGVFSGKDVQDIPTTFEQIFSSFSVSGSVVHSVPAVGRDFHGDAIHRDGNVDIVYANGFLSNDDKSVLYKDISKRLFAFSAMCNIDFSTLCESFSMLFSVGYTTLALTDGLSNSEAFSLGSIGDTDSGSLQRGSDCNTSFFKSTSDSTLTGIELLADLISGKSSLIEFADFVNRQVGSKICDITTISEFISHLGLSTFSDALTNDGIRNSLSAKGEHLANFFLHKSGSIQTGNLKFLGKRNFSGHVYDLQCFSTMYHVGGMFASNCSSLDGTIYKMDEPHPPIPLHGRCRCIMIPVTKSWRELGIDIDEIEDVYQPYTIRPDVNIDEGGRRTIIEVGFHDGDYASWFDKQSRQFKLNAIGPGRLELIEKGTITFDDLADKRTGRQRTIAELSGDKRFVPNINDLNI